MTRHRSRRRSSSRSARARRRRGGVAGFPSRRAGPGGARAAPPRAWTRPACARGRTPGDAELARRLSSPAAAALGQDPGASTPRAACSTRALSRVDAIVQQSNCVGCDGRGLAAAIAEKLPYGDTYKDRRPMPPARKFAIPEDRAVPGSIAVRRGERPGRREPLRAVRSVDQQFK